MKPKLPILCLDFDGVLHSYSSGWKGADVVPDPPVEGAMKFLMEALKKFRVSVYSSRSHQQGGREAMRDWLFEHLTEHMIHDVGISAGRAKVLAGAKVFTMIEWPDHKPPAMVTLDDRALPFEGEWPEVDDLLHFVPWNKR